MRFELLVAAMRSAQKHYFRNRSREALEDARRLEKLVDDALYDDRHKNLFDAPKDGETHEH